MNSEKKLEKIRKPKSAKSPKRSAKQLSAFQQEERAREISKYF